MIIDNKTHSIESISLDGGTPSLNLINTIHDRTKDVLSDYLQRPSDLTAWAMKAGAGDPSSIRAIESRLKLNAREGTAALRRTRELRELLYRMFYAITQNQKISQRDLTEFNTNVRNVESNVVLKHQQGRYVELWSFDDGDIRSILAPIIKDAHRLLLSDKLPRIKRCPNCGWLFLDTTKNGKRRWCSMKNCGSNVKALEWYYRNKN